MAVPDLPLPATVRLEEAAGRLWDLLVIGAGPAGAMAAREAARAGARVLLVDRAVFPRPKVCGCCINGAAMDVLNVAGLGDLLHQCRARSLQSVRLANAGRVAQLQLRHGASLSRERFDAALIHAAIADGVEFLDQTQATVGRVAPDRREVSLKQHAGERTTAAAAIVVAGGLGCRVFDEAGADQRQAWRASRVGAGTVIDVAPKEYAAGTIYMACHRYGYVGLVRLEDDRLDVAAALDPQAIKRQGGVASLAREILTHAGSPIPPGWESADWHGTGRLTQCREQVAAERCFFIGDAAGYIEPFTGEGMAWALASGRAVAPIVLALLRDARESDARQAWMAAHQRLLAKRTRVCRCVSRCLRSPALVSVAVRLLAIIPCLAQPVVRSLNTSFQVTSTLGTTTGRQP